MDKNQVPGYKHPPDPQHWPKLSVLFPQFIYLNSFIVSRSGYQLKDTVNFAEQIEAMMRQTLGVDADEQVEKEQELPEEPEEKEEEDEEEEEDVEEAVKEDEPHDEL
jgi:hypothetical protein